MKFGLILLLFVASGFSSLIYQVVWTRMMVFVFGSTTFATATVLAVFMGGLALGSFLIGRRADRIKRPFLWYGVLEGVIGVWALLTPYLFDVAGPIYRLIWQTFHVAPLPFAIIRFLAGLFILLVPTTCMGATLPLLAKFVTDSLAFVGKKVGTLYAANTLGAVGGAAVTGLYLLPVAGLSKTTFIGAMINFVLVGVVVVMSRFWEQLDSKSSALNAAEPPPNSPAFDASEANPESAKTSVSPSDEASGPSIPAASDGSLSSAVRATIFSFAVSGAVAMIYEVAWTRSLLMVIGSSTYAFTLMLTSFLLGIFLGSLVCARFIDRVKEPILWFAIIQMLVGAASVLSMNLFNYVPGWNLQLNAAFPNDPNTALVARFVIAASMMMPLTFFLGAVFPAAVKSCVKDLAAVGKSVSSLYAANTLGAIIGAFAAGFALIPVMGVEKSLIAGTVINILTGMVMLLFVRTPGVVKALVLACGCVVCASLFMRSEIWYKDVLVYAQSARRRLAITPKFASPEKWHEWLAPHLKLVFYEEGASSTVAVLQTTETKQNSLITNGHVDASEAGDMPQQILLAYAPIAAHPNPKDIAVIGWGSGVTIGTAAQLVDGKITAIELEPAVIKASPYFNAVNHVPEKDPKVSVEINDGRNFMLATAQMFDVIISEPSNPWQAGVCNLFTKEYFQLCKNRLNDGGVFALWCQIVEVPGQNIRGVLSALGEVFPYCAVMRVDKGNIVAFASDKPIKFDLEKMRSQMAGKIIINDLRTAETDTPEKFIARLIVSPDGMKEFVGDAIPNSDDTNRLEYDVGKTYENGNSFEQNKLIVNKSIGDLSTMLVLSNSAEQNAKTMCGIARQAQLLENVIGARYWISAALKAKPIAEAYRLLGISESREGNKQQAYSNWAKALELDAADIATLQTRANYSLEQGDPARAREDLNRVLALQPKSSSVLARIAHTYAPHLVLELQTQTPSTDENPEMVVKILSPFLASQEFMTTHPQAVWDAAWAYYKLERLKEAEQLARNFVSLAPAVPAGKQLLGSILLRSGNFTEASACWSQLMTTCSDGIPVLLEQAKLEMEQKRYKEALTTIQATLAVAPFQSGAMTLLQELAKKDPEGARLLTSVTRFRKDLN